MKKCLSLLLLALQCSLLVAQDSSKGQSKGRIDHPEKDSGPVVIDRGPHHRTWERVEYEPGPGGRMIARRHVYQELATGLHYQNEKGEWLESEARIEILPKNAGAIAAKGQHKVVFPPDVYDGQIELNLPDGSWLRSRVLGLSYIDMESGKNVLIAEITNSVGEIHGDNVVIYPNAFTDFRADLRYTYTREGFEQDVVLRERIPLPEEFGLNPKTTRLQVLTEFFNPPVPAKTDQAVEAKSGDTIPDQALGFGAMQMGAGKAFPQASDSGEAIPVGKQWQKLEGRDFLIEEVQTADLLPFLDNLSKPDGASLNTTTKKTRRLASVDRKIPAQRRVAKQDQKGKKEFRFVSALQPKDGFVLDYVTMNTSLTNYVFQSDTTYYFSGNVSLYGTNTTFEGGTVLKYTNNVTLTVNTPVKWLGESYRPVVLTAKDDNSVGETINGSTGSPGSNYYAANALFFNAATASTNLVLQNLRVANATRAVAINTKSGHVLSHVQFVKCAYGLSLTNAEVSLRNAIMYQVLTNFTGSSSTGRVEHLTSHQTSRINGNIGSNLFLTNSLLVLITNATSFTSINNRTNSAATGIFTNVVAGYHYLVTGSTNRNAGTTNINAALLSDLKKLTTYPPLVVSNLTISTATNWSPQVQRDTDAPDIGYHYSPIDYSVFGVTVSGAALTLTNGVVLASQGGGAGISGTITIRFSGSLISDATPQNLNHLCRILGVQEQSITWAGYPYSTLYPEINPQSVSLRFTAFDGMSGMQSHLIGRGPLTVQNCSFSSGGLEIQTQDTVVQNSYFDRVGMDLKDVGGAGSLDFQNTLIKGGKLTITNTYSTQPWVIRNNAFHDCSITSGSSLSVSNSHNAYINTSGTLALTNSTDVFLSNFAYAAGPLGNYYQQSTNLLNAGSTNASVLGLYHFTTQTNQVKETNSVVDIGYHYVALNASGLPFDFDGDGTPDYVEDKNGNGTVDAGETEWRVVITNQPQSQTISAGGSVTFTVGASGTPLYYRWLFNGTNALTATNASLTFNPVSATNAGVYSVIVSNANGQVVSSNATLTVTCLSQPSGLVAWWQGEFSAYDSISNNHGYLFNGSYTNGYQNKGFSFSSTATNYAIIPDASALRPANFTLEAWVYPVTSASGYRTVILKGQAANSHSFALYSQSDDAYPTVEINTSGTYKITKGTNTVPLNKWSHLAGTYNGTNLILYVNGVESKRQAYSGAVSYAAGPVFIGGNTVFGGEYFNGQIDEAAVYNRALSASEISNLYLAGSIGKCPPSPKIIPGQINTFSGKAATFTVVGSGAAPVNYQWLYSGTNIAGATNATLAFANPQPTNAGTYSVVLSNSQGVATASDALLVNSCYTAVDVALVVDRSGSMTNIAGSGLTRIAAARAACTNFIQSLNYTNDQVGIVTFSDNATTDQTLTNNQSGLLQKVGQIVSDNGGTYMGNALMAAQMELMSQRHHPNALPVLVFLTDGQPTDSTNYIQSLATQIKNAGTHLITVGLGADMPATAKDLLRTIASTTNDFYYATNSIQLTNVYSLIADSICRGPDGGIDVSIVTPTNGFSMLAQQAVTVGATASSGFTNISWVQFYASTNGSSSNTLGFAVSANTNGLYEMTWLPLVGGTYTLTAKAQDARGSNVISVPVTVNVRSRPSVVITNPVNQAIFGPAPVNISISANASASGATITNVSYYLSNSTNLIGFSTTAPSYMITWSNVAAGSYLLAAKVTDSLGASAFSQPVAITVRPPNLGPLVNAGSDLAVHVGETNLLLGAISDDGWPSNFLASAWSRISGLGTVTFGNTNQASTTVVFNQVGTNVLQLKGTDGAITNSDTVTIVVLVSNLPPVVEAGTNQFFILPAVESADLLTTMIHIVEVTNMQVVAGGVDYFAPSNSVIISVATSPSYNLFAADGTLTEFSEVSGLSDMEAYLATARNTLGGFRIGEVFAGFGGIVENQVYSVPHKCELMRITPEGQNIGNLGDSGRAWVILTNETHLKEENSITSLWVDRTGVWGGDLIVVTMSRFSSGFDVTGDVWRVNSAGGYRWIAQLKRDLSKPNQGAAYFEGVTTIPNDGAKYGPWAGRIIVGGDYAPLFAVDTNGVVAAFDLGIGAEDVLVIPEGENWYAADDAQKFWGASASEFQGMAGDVLIVDEVSPGGSQLNRVRWNGKAFEIYKIGVIPGALAGQANFIPAGLFGVPAANYLQLRGVVSDDGHLNPLTNYWLNISGPGSATFDDPSQTNTLARFHDPGTNYFRLVASDGEYTSYDDVRIDVIRNLRPTVSAGTNKVIPTFSTTLFGSATDDGWPFGQTNLHWTLTSGPVGGTAYITNSGSATTQVGFSTNGVYVLRLTVDDGQATNRAEVTVTVNIPRLILSPERGWPSLTNTQHIITATLLNESNQPMSGVDVEFSVTGHNYIWPETHSTDASGQVTFSYTGTNYGHDVISATTIGLEVEATATATKEWGVPLSCGEFDQSYAQAMSLTWPVTEPHDADYYLASVVAGTPITLDYTNRNNVALVLRDATHETVAVTTSGHLEYIPVSTGQFSLEVVNTHPATNGNFTLTYHLSRICDEPYVGTPAIKTFVFGTNLPNGGTITYPTTTVGYPTNISLIISNAGDANLILTNMSIGAGFSFSGPTTYTFTPGSWLRLPLVFSATTNGPKVGDLILPHNAAGLTNVVHLVADALPASYPIIRVYTNDVYANYYLIPTNSPIGFPPTTAGHPTNLSLIISNVGTANLQITNVLIFGDFDNQSGTGFVILPGESTNINLRFLASSNHTALGQVVLQNNAPQDRNYIVYLVGKASPAGDPPSISLGFPGDWIHGPRDVTIPGSAWGNGARVTRVEIYEILASGAVMVGSTNNPNVGDDFTPFYYNWEDTPTGSHTVAAVAYHANGRSTVSELATFTVFPNRPPYAADDYVVVLPNSVSNHFYYLITGSTGNYGGVDSDPDNDSLTNFMVGTEAAGTATLDENGWVNYTPPTNTFGSDAFTYVISDGYGAYATGVVHVAVTVPRIPEMGILYDGNYVPNGGTVVFPDTIPGSPTNISFTITNYGNAPFQITQVITNGDFAPTNELTGLLIVPAGSNLFSVVFYASTNGTSIGSLTMVLDGAEDPYSIYFVGSAVATGAPPVISLTAPVESAPFYAPGIVDITASVTAGTSDIDYVDFLVQTTNGTFYLGRREGNATSYNLAWANVPEGNYTLTATAVDVDQRSATSQPVAIHVAASNGNKPPVAVVDRPTVLANSVNNIFDPRANDSDPDGDPLVITWVSQPMYGTNRIVNGGTAVSFSPERGFASPPGVPGDGFYYIVSDGRGGTAKSAMQFYITVSPIPEPWITYPAADCYTTNAGRVLPITATITNTPDVVSVEFFRNGISLGVTTNRVGNNFTLNWIANYNPACNCPISAQATDKYDQVGTSPSRCVLIDLPLGVTNPVVSIETAVSSLATNVFSQDNTVTIREGIFDLFGRAYQIQNSNIVWHLGIYSTDGKNELIREITPSPYSADGGNTLHIGNASASNLLAHCDLSALDNGLYEFRLSATAGYISVSTSVRFRLECSLKIGQFGFSQQDLAIPVNGIPLTVIRTYNSMNPRLGDFGYGWTYAINGMDVELHEEREDVPDVLPSIYTDDEDFLYSTTYSQRVSGNYDVTLTLPDGQRTTFYFYQANPPHSMVNYARWTNASPQVTATLEGLGPLRMFDFTMYAAQIPPGIDTPIFWEGDGQLNGYHVPYDNYDFRGWVLKTLDGTRYIIEREDLGMHTSPNDNGYPFSIHNWGKPKLTRIEQLNGDVIRINADSIEHWDGNTNLTRQVKFVRDGDGLIIGVTDPMSLDANGNTNGPLAMKYEYDSRQNLINVLQLVNRTNIAYVTNSFAYTNVHFPHYITSMIDARGITVARNEYDDDGRLTAVTDANGKTTRFYHNTTNRMEVITDRLGYTNTYVYDLRGNVTIQTNALGIATFRKYDDANREIAVTNAFGTSSMTWSLHAYDQYGNATNVVNSGHTNSFSYDTRGNLLTQVDPLGNVTTNVYNSHNNLIYSAQLGADGRTNSQSSAYYWKGLLKVSYNANGQGTASFDYSQAGDLTSTTDANGVTRIFGYDRNGNQTGSYYNWTNPATGQIIQPASGSEYDAAGRVVRSVDVLNNETRTVYNAGGKVDYSVDKFGNTNSFLYDTRGNLIQTTSADGLKTQTVYDDNGRAILTTDRNGITGTQTIYDAAGRVTSTIRRMNVLISIESDSQYPAIKKSVIVSLGTPVSTNSTVYFESGWVKYRIGADGKTNSYAYWPDGQTMYVTNALGQTTFYKYDIGGRQDYVADALNRTNRFEYDGGGRMIKTIYQDGTFTTNIFNNLGQRTGVKDQANFLTQYAYDLSGQLTNVTKPSVYNPETGNPGTPTWSYKYDMYGRLTVTTDPKGRSTTNSYDAYGREVSRWLPMGGAGTTNLYNQFGQITNQVDFKGQQKRTRYDRFGRVTTNSWFAAGATYPSNLVCYYYNQLGQLTNITERFGTDASSTYIASVGWPGNGLDGRARHSVRAAVMAYVNRVPAEAQGGFAALLLCAFALICIPREKRRQLALGAAEVWRAHLLTLSAGGEGRGEVARSQTHLRSLPSAIFHLPISLIALCSYAAFVLRCGGTPDGTPRRFRLPSFGWRLASIITLIAVIGSDPRFDGLWTARAACTVTANNNSTETTRITTFTYDVEGRLAQVNSPEGVINYDYDLITGRHAGTCTKNSETTYEYDALGRLWKAQVLKRNGTNVTENPTIYTYTAVGSRETVTLPNGVVTTYQYDGLNRLTNLVNKVGSTTLLSQFSYKLDATGRRTNAVEILKQESGSPAYQTNTLSWAYDGLYRLTNEVCVAMVASASYTNRFQYDLAGNRWSQVRIVNSGTTTITNQYNANDQLLKEVTLNGSGVPTATNNYVYDANGSLLAKTNLSGSSSTVLYGYDLKNKLSNATTAGSGVTNYYRYNDQGIRVRTSSSSGGSPTLYLVDGNNHTGYAQVLEELSAFGGSPDKSYVLGDDVLGQCGTDTNDPRWLLYDGHGSTRQLSDDAGVVTSRYNYEAYGTTLTTSTGSPETSLLYCGEQYDKDLGMYNLRARFYDSSNGRFNARDSFDGSNFDPQSLHKYLYVHNDPINGVDPSGLFSSMIELLSVFATTSIVAAGVGLGLAPQQKKARAILAGVALGLGVTISMVEVSQREALIAGILSATAVFFIDSAYEAAFGKKSDAYTLSPEIKFDMFEGFCWGYLDGAIQVNKEVPGLDSLKTFLTAEFQSLWTVILSKSTDAEKKSTLLRDLAVNVLLLAANVTMEIMGSNIAKFRFPASLADELGRKSARLVEAKLNGLAGIGVDALKEGYTEAVEKGADRLSGESN